MVKTKHIVVNNTEISVLLGNKEDDYICLTDMARFKDTAKTDYTIQNWMRVRNTIEYLGAWEQLNNPNFKPLEFEGFRNQAGLNSFVLTPKQWVEKTNAIGIYSKSGRYGGTYAHKDIAFNFGMWLSPVFQLYVVKEYQHLKEAESNPLLAQWRMKRLLSKTNYTLHTDAIKTFIVPKVGLSAYKRNLAYATEADMLNLILFGCTAKDWEEANPDYAKKGMNVRDTASINQLIVLSNLEAMNSELIKQNILRSKRMTILHKIAKDQLSTFDRMNIEQKFRQIDNDSTKQLE